MKIPCQDCITLAICKALVHEHVLKKKGCKGCFRCALTKKCSIIEDMNLSGKDDEILSEIFNIKGFLIP
jgi:multimeric flavodoxin WrbA